MTRTRIIAPLLMLLLALSGFGYASLAHAQAAPVQGPTPSGATLDQASGPLQGPTQGGATLDSAQGSGTTDASKGANGNPTTPQQSSQSWLSWIMNAIMSLFAWLVGVAALTLDNSVYYTVVHMGAFTGLNGQNTGLSSIGIAWRVLRDVGNIILIFGFLAVGITMILGVDLYGSATKMIPTLIISAVFLNFSLFISGAVISMGNFVATQVYTQINGGVPAQATSYSISDLYGGGNVHTEGISNKIMAQLGLQTIYGDPIKNPRVFSGLNAFFIGFMGIILFLITAFVFFSLALMFIARFVMLVLLMVVAPIGFAGYAIPQLSGYAKKWWSYLIDQTITAPVLLLLLYVALRVITDTQFLADFGVGGSNYSGCWTGFVDVNNLTCFGGIFLSFAIAMGLLLVVVMAAKEMGAAGAGWATRVAGKATGFLSFGAISLGARGTLGTAGYLLNNKRFQAAAAGKGAGAVAARVAAFTGRNLENRTFDFRNAPGARALGGLVGQRGTGAGAIFQGGAKVGAKEAIDKSREALKYYKPTQGEWWREQQRAYEKAKAEDVHDKIIADPTNKDFAKELNKMSADEISELQGIRKGLAEYVEALAPAKYAELKKSNKLLAGEKQKMTDTWKQQFTVIPGVNEADVKARLSKLPKIEDVADLDEDILKQSAVASTFDARHMEAIRRKKPNMSEEDRREIYAEFTRSNPAGAAKYVADDKNGVRQSYWNV